MRTLISTTAHATDSRNLELRQPLVEVPIADVRVLIFVEGAAPTNAASSAADFLAWARRPRPAIGLRDAGRDVICDD